MSATPSGMVKICPECNGKMKCIDTRVSSEADRAIRRRYKCQKCDLRYSTIEVHIEDYLELKYGHDKYVEFVEVVRRAFT